MATTIKPFDVRKGLTVNGLEFVDEFRNVTLNNLTVRGVSTIVDTRSVTTSDPVIELGASGNLYTTSGIKGTSSEYLIFSAEAIADIAPGDAIIYTGVGGDLQIPDPENPPNTKAFPSDVVYYVQEVITDKNNQYYGGVKIASTLSGLAEDEITSTVVTDFSESASGGEEFQVNPIIDLNQDLGISFNYSDAGSPTKGFFGYKDSDSSFTFLTKATEDTAGIFTGTKGKLKVAYLDLELGTPLTAGSEPALKIAQSWDNASINFDAIDLNISDTASASGSSLVKLAVDSTSVLRVAKTGYVGIGTDSLSGALTISAADDAGTGIDLSQTWASAAANNTGIKVTVTDQGGDDTCKLIDLISGSVGYSIDKLGKINSSVTFNDPTLPNPASLTAFKLDVTDTASAIGSLLLDLQVGSSSKFSVSKEGNVTAAGTITVSGISSDSELTGTNAINLKGTKTDFNSLQTTVDLYSLKGAQTEIAGGSSNAERVFSFATADFTTAKLLIQIRNTQNTSKIQSTEILINHGGGDAFITEYGTVYSGTDVLGQISAAISGNNLEVYYTNTQASVALNELMLVSVTATLIK